MENRPTELARLCRGHLARFFADHPNGPLEARSLKALRSLVAGDARLAGKTEGWSAGILYAVANWDRQACGVPGLLNSELASAFGVSMETIRKRAAQVKQLLDV